MINRRGLAILVPLLHNAAKTGKTRKTAMDGRTLRHAGYQISQRIRKRIEEVFGWIKKPGGLAKAKVRGKPKVDAVFTFAVIAYNLIRLPKLMREATADQPLAGQGRPSKRPGRSTTEPRRPPISANNRARHNFFSSLLGDLGWARQP